MAPLLRAFGSSRRSLACLALAAALGCSSYQGPLGEFTLILPNRGDLPFTIIDDLVWGETCVEMNLLDLATRRPISTSDHPLSYAEAVERAIREAPGANALVDVDLTYTITEYLLWTRQCARAEGKAARYE